MYNPTEAYSIHTSIIPAKPFILAPCFLRLYRALYLFPNTIHTIMASPSQTYNSEQLELYLKRIGYADSINATPDNNATGRLHHVLQSIQQNRLATLTELQRRHLASIPWGNSALHYSQHRSISIHPAAIFDKLVVRRLDGYCMENTNLFYMVLRCLGYYVYPTGGRVSQAVAGGNQTPGSELYMNL